MWRTEVLSKTFRIWGLCSSHHLLNIKTLTAMGYFWGTANFNNTLRYPTCSFKRKYYCKFWKNSSTWSIIRSLIFLERIRNKCWDFETAPPDISLMSFCYFRPITTTLSGSLQQFAAFWALKILENKTYFYECLYIIQGTCKGPPCY